MDLVALLAPKGIRGCLRVRLRGVKVASTSRAAESVQRAWKHGCVSSFSRGLGSITRKTRLFDSCRVQAMLAFSGGKGVKEGGGEDGD